MPIWIADYVLMSYGTGAIMAVPAHDERDHAFARPFDLPIVTVVRPVDGRDVEEAFEGDGMQVNSAFLDGLTVDDAKRKIVAWLEEHGPGKPRVRYRLRDWLFSRQRYWGEPFPLLHLEDGTVVPVPDDALPLLLPDARRLQADRRRRAAARPCRGVGPHHRPASGAPALRETNTMPQWAGSCWYYLRYIDPDNETALVDPDEENVLDAGRSLHRRRRARGAAPSLCAFLAQGAVRHRPRVDAGAVPASCSTRG